MTLAVGAHGHENNKGTIRVYSIFEEEALSGGNDKGTITIKEQTNMWTQIGNDIDGENSSSERSSATASSSAGFEGGSGDKQGYTVSISSDGMRLAVGAVGHNNNSGSIRAFNLVNNAPDATDQSVNAEEQTAVEITLSASDSNPNTTFTYKISSLPSDGELSENGTVINSGDLPKTLSGDKVSYKSNSDTATSDSFTFKANDGSVDSHQPATVSITISPVNDAPVATDQSVTTVEDIPLEITLAGTDPESDPLTYVIVTSPSNGSVTLVGNKATYVPSEGFFGSDSFTFKVNDGTLDSTLSATVTITVNSNDTDGDGVLNDVDECPNTPEGSVVNFKGCAIFSLSANNNKVQVTSTSCVGISDGSVSYTHLRAHET